MKHVVDRLLETKTADKCRKIVQRAIVLTKEHQFEQLRQKLGVI
jgi:hypothetical protein